MSNILKLDDYRPPIEWEIDITPEIQAIIDLYIARNGGTEDEAIEALIRLGIESVGTDLK